MIIRAFHSSQIAWAFRPTIEEIPSIHQEGIWLPDFQAGKGQEIGHSHEAVEATEGETEGVLETTEAEEVSTDDLSDESEGESEEDSEEEDDDGVEEDKQESAKPSGKPAASQSAFALLALDGDGSAEEEDSG